MPVALEFINIIVPIEVVDRYYPGGFTAFKSEKSDMFGGRLWHDDYLLRDGAMNPMDAKATVDYWQNLGASPQGNVEGKLIWKDVCVVEHMLGGITLPCDWIVLDKDRSCAYMKEKPSEPIVGRDDFNSEDQEV